MANINLTAKKNRSNNTRYAALLLISAATLIMPYAQATSVGIRVGMPKVGIDLNPNSSLFPSVNLQSEPKIAEYIALDVDIIGFNISLFNLNTALNDISVQGGIFDSSALFDNIDSASASGTGVVFGYGARIDVKPVYFNLGAGIGGGKFTLDVGTNDNKDFSESTGLLIWQLRGGIGFSFTENFGISADYRYFRTPNIGIRLEGQTGDASMSASIISAGIDFKL